MVSLIATWNELQGLCAFQLLGLGRVGFLGHVELPGQVIEVLNHAHTDLTADRIILMTKEEVDGVDLVVDEPTHRVAIPNATTVLLDLRFLLGKGRERNPQTTYTAVCRVELGARTGHRYPQRRVAAPQPR